MIEPLRRVEHYARFGLAGQEHAADIDVVELLPFLQRQRLGRLGPGDAGIVDGDGQRAEFLLGAFDRRCQIGL